MWDSEADKYWKEKEKAKRRALLQKKIAAICAALLVGIVLFKWYSAEEPPVPKSKPANNETVVPNDILVKCHDSCKVHAIDHCNAACRHTRMELPRPVIFKACQMPCINLAQSLCQLAAKATPSERKQCQQSGRNDIHRTCKGYENQLPRPRIQNICDSGATAGSGFSCSFVEKCIGDQMKFLAKREESAQSKLS